MIECTVMVEIQADELNGKITEYDRHHLTCHTVGSIHYHLERPQVRIEKLQNVLFVLLAQIDFFHITNTLAAGMEKRSGNVLDLL